MCDSARKICTPRISAELPAPETHLCKSEGERAGGLRGTCGGCPFNAGMTEEAEMAQNYGCLPTPGEVVELKRTTGANWACHSDETKVCAGLCHAAEPEQLDLSQGGLLRYSTWYHQSQDAAISEAAKR
jgi:hypothetical protein